MKPKAVVIYCFENPETAKLENPQAEDHIAAAILLGTELAERGIDIVMGGMKNGLMGVVTDAALQAGGRVIGIIPADFPIENRHPGLSETHIVADAYERKRLMMKQSDASITLPGGKGTSAELFHELDIMKEVSKSYAQASTYGVAADRPVVVFDPDGFYKPLIELARNMGTVKGNTKDADSLHVVTNIRKALLATNVISQKEHDKIYDLHRGALNVDDNERVDKYLKPASTRTKRRLLQHGAAIIAAGTTIVGAGLLGSAFFAPKYVAPTPGAPAAAVSMRYLDAVNDINAGTLSMAEALKVHIRPDSEVDFRLLGADLKSGNPERVAIAQAAQMEAAKPEQEMTTNEKLSSGILWSGALAGVGALMSGMGVRRTAKVRPLIKMPSPA